MINTQLTLKAVRNHMLIALGLVFVLHIGAEMLDLYYILPWWDIVTHFLGGVFIGFLLLYILGQRFKKITIGGWNMFVWVFLLGLIVGVGWEIFQYILNVVIPYKPYIPFDTELDIIMDMLGVTVAYVWTKLFLIYKQ